MVCVFVNNLSFLLRLDIIGFAVVSLKKQRPPVLLILVNVIQCSGQQLFALSTGLSILQLCHGAWSLHTDGARARIQSAGKKKGFTSDICQG